MGRDKYLKKQHAKLDQYEANLRSIKGNIDNYRQLIAKLNNDRDAILKNIDEITYNMIYQRQAEWQQKVGNVYKNKQHPNRLLKIIAIDDSIFQNNITYNVVKMIVTEVHSSPNSIGAKQKCISSRTLNKEWELLHDNKEFDDTLRIVINSIVKY